MAIEKSPLSAQDVCLIIKACGEAKVQELTFNGLRVKFSSPDQELYELVVPGPEARGPQPPATPSSSNPEAATPGQTHEKINELSLVAEEVKTREDELEMALIEDPVLAENLIIAGKLEEEANGSTDDDA